MSKRYSDEFKEPAIKQMMPPNPVSIPKLSSEIGVSDVTLYKWRNLYRNKGVAVPGDKSKPENWSAGDKLAVDEYESRLDEELAWLKKDFESWSYKPNPVLRVEIQKPGKGAGVRLLVVRFVKMFTY